VAADAQVVAIVFEKFFELARATLVSLSSVSLEVPLAWLPSRMFCLPERAACTIWSRVRERLSTKRSQKRTVPSKTMRAF